MNNKFSLLKLIIPLVMFIAACGSGAGGPGPSTWIDAPLDGMTFELGPVIVRSHAASDAGTSQAALMVNGEQVRVDEAADSVSPLIEFAQTWTPAANGEYSLQVITTDHTGNEGRSNIVRVRIGEVPEDATSTPGTETTTSTVAVTPTETPTDIPTITFTQNTNCRLGDSTAYDAVDSYEQGETLLIEGRNAATTWFWVLRPNSATHCWVSGSTGTLAGPYQTVPVIAPPPLPATDTPEPAQGAPVAPGNLHVSGEVCNAQEYKVTIQWGDVSGEDGYRVYRDGALIATLGANTTTYTDTPPNYNAHNYGVEAFNGAGTSGRPIVGEDGCVF